MAERDPPGRDDDDLRPWGNTPPWTSAARLFYEYHAAMQTVLGRPGVHRVHRRRGWHTLSTATACAPRYCVTDDDLVIA
jgi:hypothetical protein